MIGPVIEFIRHRFGYQFPRVGPLGFRLFKSLAPATLNSELFPGIRVPLNLKDSAQLSTYWSGYRFEYPTPQILIDWCEGAEAFFDIGANYGFYSYMLYHRCPRLDIHAFEPNPVTFRTLEAARDQNNLHRLHLHPIGLSSVADTLDLHPGSFDLGATTFGPHPDYLHNTIAKVAVKPFDLFCAEQNLAWPSCPAWVAKIDVEGFDFKVLQGMQHALQARAFKGISVEMNEFNLAFCQATTRDIRDYLARFGYATAFPPFTAFPGKVTTDNEFFVPVP